MRRVIIESPFRGETSYQQTRNRRYAQECMRDSMLRGEAPFLSHLLYTQVLNEEIPEERELGINVGLFWGEIADATIVYTDNGITAGMIKGIDHAKACGRPVEYRTIADIRVGDEFSSVKLSAILTQVSNHFGLKPSDLRGRDRKRDFVDARHIFCTVSKELYPKVSLQSIGQVINRDHATVIHAVKEVYSVREKRKKFNDFCESKSIRLCL